MTDIPLWVRIVVHPALPLVLFLTATAVACYGVATYRNQLTLVATLGMFLSYLLLRANLILRREVKGDT